jgi:hypothetical protein
VGASDAKKILKTDRSQKRAWDNASDDVRNSGAMPTSRSRSGIDE